MKLVVCPLFSAHQALTLSDVCLVWGRGDENQIRWFTIFTKLCLMQVNVLRQSAFATIPNSHAKYTAKQNSIHFDKRFHRCGIEKNLQSNINSIQNTEGAGRTSLPMGIRVNLKSKSRICADFYREILESFSG